NIEQIEYSRHRSFNNFIANFSAIVAYCFFEKKSAIDVIYQ
ncbi:IS982 family transposase, partial [Bacillus safensis]|nr:IS982 family transposase [Bacillus safensis]